MNRPYTFGDSASASARLRKLAELYEPETRELLGKCASRPRVAVDLGCGPGWSTTLIRETLQPQRTIGLDGSDNFVTEAQLNHGPLAEFMRHDVTQSPFPVPAPNFLFCRFLLAHLHDVTRALNTWAEAAAPGALLAIHETERLESDNPEMRLYYRLLGRMQHHHGQDPLVGAKLEEAVRATEWRVVESLELNLKKPTHAMAQLHRANLRTWRHDEYARSTFDSAEIDELDAALGRLAQNTTSGFVLNAARQMVLRR